MFLKIFIWAGTWLAVSASTSDRFLKCDAGQQLIDGVVCTVDYDCLSNCCFESVCNPDGSKCPLPVECPDEEVDVAAERKRQGRRTLRLAWGIPLAIIGCVLTSCTITMIVVLCCVLKQAPAKKVKKPANAGEEQPTNATMVNAKTNQLE